jgi:hypothetical protein
VGTNPAWWGGGGKWGRGDQGEDRVGSWDLPALEAIMTDLNITIKHASILSPFLGYR